MFYKQRFLLQQKQQRLVIFWKIQQQLNNEPGLDLKTVEYIENDCGCILVVWNENFDSFTCIFMNLVFKQK